MYDALASSPDTVIRGTAPVSDCIGAKKSRRRCGRSPVSVEIRRLIREMSVANPLWGAPRIHGELSSSASRSARPASPSIWRGGGDLPRRDGEIFIGRVRSIGIRDRPTSPRSPWQNAYAERLIGSIRRECLDHVVVFANAICAMCCCPTWTIILARALTCR
jgi:hypothetical protein